MPEQRDGSNTELVAPAGLTRRRLVSRGAAAGAGLSVLGNVLAACGGSSSSQGHSASVQETPAIHGLSELPGGTPTRGGTLTVGTQSGGTAENLFPGTGEINSDYARQYNLFNLLFYTGTTNKELVPGLALSAEPNSDATKWTFHLRDGVTWHNGKPFGADDLVWNFTHIWPEPSNLFSPTLNGVVDFKSARKRDKLTVEVSLLQPTAEFPSLFVSFNGMIVQSGMTAKDVEHNPVGTGPFVYQSFTPGQRSVFTANKNYWEEGRPYVDRLVVDSSFTDPTAQMNALLGGQIDLLPFIPLTTARDQLTSKQVQVLSGPAVAQAPMMVMRVDKGPMTDVRVRQGFFLLIDRQAMSQAALSGWGAPGNDLFCPGAKYFATDLVRHQDVERAKSLFKAAGVLGHTFTLQTANVLPSMVASATVLSQQAPAAGIRVRPQLLGETTYYTPSGGYVRRVFGQDQCNLDQSLTLAYRSFLVANAPYGSTKWGAQPGGKASLKLISEAIAATDSSRATALWHAAQEQQFRQGGNIIWATYPYVDGARNNIRGLAGGSGFSFNSWRFQDGWLAS